MTLSCSITVQLLPKII